MTDDGAVWVAELHGGPEDGAEKRLSRFSDELWFPASLTGGPVDVPTAVHGRDCFGRGLVRVAYSYVGVKP
jgi:hypothetical protein